MANIHAPISPEKAKKQVILHVALFAALIVLTIVQIIIKSQGIGMMENNVIQSIIALFKVFLVAYYFMHLKDEALWLKFIAILPIFAVLYTVFVAVESVVR
jgi:cytochrome c oxidase subunit 4